MSAPVVVLVGPPGAGKTTVGQLVAERLAVPFRDTDVDVETAAGMSVSDIFLSYGEQRFRELEKAVTRTALGECDGVLALGGGAVLDAETRAALRGHRVVFLDVGLADAAARVGFNRDRPLLLGNPRAALSRLLAARLPLYREVATATVATAGRDAEQVAEEVLALLGWGRTRDLQP